MSRPHRDRVWVNGTWRPMAEATVPLLDAGLLVGHAVYEAYRLYAGVPFRLAAHLARLRAAADALGLPWPAWPPADEVTRECQSAGRDGLGYLLITPTTAACFEGDLTPLPAELWTRGASIRLMDDIRWRACHLKTTFLLPNALAIAMDRAEGYDETVFVRDGWLQEGSHSNVWVVVGGQAWTPPVGPGVLPGITRAAVLDAAREVGVPVLERPVSLALAASADEWFVCSTTFEVLPVVTVGGRPIGDGRPGPVTTTLRQAFLALRDRELAAARPV